MRSLTIYTALLLLGCLTSAAQGQSSEEQKTLPLPAAKHGQPAFSFEGGKRVSVQKTTTAGLHEYGADGGAGGGTGIVEVGAGSHSSSNGINVVPSGTNHLGIGTGSGTGTGTGSRTGITDIPTGLGTGITVVPTGTGKIVGKSALTGNTGRAAGGGGKGKPKPATTVVQILGPDGKMEYKEVPFMGELSSTKRAPNITEVKDGEGKVKEYDWIKKRH
jgi:hypothetical protein